MDERTPSTIPLSPFANTRSRVCSVEGCELKVRAKGLCHKHYNSSRTAGTTDGVSTGPVAKLTDEQCKAIRRRSAGFATYIEIAAEFGISVSTVRRVIKKEGPYAEDRHG